MSTEQESCYQLEFREVQSGRVSAVVIRATPDTLQERVRAAVRGLERNSRSAVDVLSLHRLPWGEQASEKG